MTEMSELKSSQSINTTVTRGMFTSLRSKTFTIDHTTLQERLIICYAMVVGKVKGLL